MCLLAQRAFWEGQVQRFVLLILLRWAFPPKQVHLINVATSRSFVWNDITLVILLWRCWGNGF